MQDLINWAIKSLSSITGETSQWFWSMAQTLIILGSLIFIYRQVRVQRFSNMLQTLSSLRENWNNDTIVAARKTTCINYQKGTKNIGKAEGEVLGFFEELGLLLKKRVVSTEFIWESYSYFIEHYWSMLEPNIKEFRLSTNDNSWYDNFESLRKAIGKYSKKRKCPSSDKTEEEIKRFIRGEIEDFTEKLHLKEIDTSS